MMDDAVLDTIDRLNRQFLTMADHLSALQELAELRHSTHGDLSSLLHEALGILLLRGDFQTASVFLREGEHLRCHAGLSREDLISETARKHPTPHRFRLDKGVAGLVATTGRMRHCRDTRFERHYLPLPGHEIRSLLCLPLRDRQETLGVLNVSHGRRNAFDETHERFLDVFSAFLTQLVAHWRLTHRLEEALAERTRELENAVRRLEARNRWHDRMTMLDPVTGLCNERFLVSELRRLGARAARADGTLALLLVQLHATTDDDQPLDEPARRRLWSLAAGLLRTQIREGDILCHLGEGRFALCLPDGSRETTRQLAERIRDDLASLNYRTGDKTLNLQPVFGAAEARAQPVDGGTVARIDTERLLAEAQAALQATEMPEGKQYRRESRNWCRKSDSN